jgi:hypothetical protein
MAADNFSPHESLQLIRDMIDKTRSNISSQSHYFLLWGWCTLAACLGQFVLNTVFRYEKHYLVWLITIPCIIVNTWFTIRDRKSIRVKTYIDDNMEFLWTGVGVSFFVVSMIFVKLGWENCYPFYIMLYGLGSFVTGRILQFKPFLIGGIISWCLAVTSIWFSFEYQPLFACGALLCTYIIPGHLFRRVERRSNA